MNTIEKLLRAARFAAERHAGQFRKGSSQTPYINHPLTVAEILSRIAGVNDPDILAAAILHDTVEDVGVTRDEIADQFGEAVAAYVMEVTDDKSLDKAVRKQTQIDHAPHLSAGAKLIKLADKITNVRDVTDDPGIDWTLERRKDYIDWAENVAAGLRGINEPLDNEFDHYLLWARKEIV